MSDQVQIPPVDNAGRSRLVTAQSSPRKKIWSWIRTFALVAIVFLLFHNLTGFIKVSGDSMNSSLNSGDILLLDKWSFFVKKPQYGDVIIIEDQDLGYRIVKRVIAVEGDRISIVNGVTLVNGSPLTEIYAVGVSGDMDEVEVQANHVFVMGDNRTPGESLDSRSDQIGPVHLEEIKSFAFVSIWPMKIIAKPLELE